jgi:peptidoglycan hydrolase-like protein with peptidoglycan-binding domain
MYARRTLPSPRNPARGKQLLRRKMTKLSIAAPLVFASLVCACSMSAHAANIASVTPRPQQSSPSPAPGTSSAAAPSTTTANKKKSTKKHHASKREPTQKAPTPERISEIQSALARGGYYQGSPNGKWDSNTVSAMQKFQSENGLSSSGKIDAPSLQKLGLGSATAGVDAPKSIAPPKSGASSSSASPPGPTTTSAAPPSANATSASSVAPSASSAPTTPKQQ